MKEQDKTLKQALQKAANEGAIAEDPSVEITPSAELDKKMNAFFDSVESRNAESTEQQYTSDKSGTVGNNYSDVLLDAFESDIADYDRDYDDPDTVESKNHGDSNAVGFGGKIRSLFVPFSRRTVGVILFAIAGVLLVVSLVSMAKTAAVNKKHDSNPTPSEQPTLSGTAIPEGGTPTPRIDGKDTDSTAQPGITKILTAHRAPEISARPHLFPVRLLRHRLPMHPKRRYPHRPQQRPAEAADRQIRPQHRQRHLQQMNRSFAPHPETNRRNP